MLSECRNFVIGLKFSIMEYQVKHDPEQHRFEVHLEGNTAYLEYELEEEEMDITHTIVPPSLEGRGIASALMKQALVYADQEHLKVIPICSFAAAYMGRHQ